MGFTPIELRAFAWLLLLHLRCMRWIDMGTNLLNHQIEVLIMQEERSKEAHDSVSENMNGKV